MAMMKISASIPTWDGRLCLLPVLEVLLGLDSDNGWDLS